MAIETYLSQERDTTGVILRSALDDSQPTIRLERERGVVSIGMHDEWVDVNVDDLVRALRFLRVR